MSTLKKILESKIIEDEDLRTSFKKMLLASKKLRDNFKKLSLMEIFNILTSISYEIKNLKKIFKSKKKILSENLLLDFSTKEYFGDIEKLILPKASSKSNFGLQFNLIEAIEELYKMLEIFCSFRTSNKDSNYLWNIFYEIYLNLDQHYLYHYRNLKNLIGKTSD